MPLLSKIAHVGSYSRSRTKHMDWEAGRMIVRKQCGPSLYGRIMCAGLYASACAPVKDEVVHRATQTKSWKACRATGSAVFVVMDQTFKNSGCEVRQLHLRHFTGRRQQASVSGEVLRIRWALLTVLPAITTVGAMIRSSSS